MSSHYALFVSSAAFVDISQLVGITNSGKDGILEMICNYHLYLLQCERTFEESRTWDHVDIVTLSAADCDKLVEICLKYRYEVSTPDNTTSSCSIPAFIVFYNSEEKLAISATDAKEIQSIFERSLKLDF